MTEVQSRLRESYPSTQPLTQAQGTQICLDEIRIIKVGKPQSKKVKRRASKHPKVPQIQKHTVPMRSLILASKHGIPADPRTEDPNDSIMHGSIIQTSDRKHWMKVQSNDILKST